MGATWIPLAGIVGALVTFVIGALTFNRKDAKAIVETQSMVLDDMQSLIKEHAEATKLLRVERDELIARVSECGIEVQNLEHSIRNLRIEIHDNAQLAKQTISGLTQEVQTLLSRIRELKAKDGA